MNVAPPREASPLRASLEKARRELLDLSARNRLLNTPRRHSRSSSVEIVEGLAETVFRLLVRDGKTMRFAPAQEPAEESAEGDAPTSQADEAPPETAGPPLAQPDEELEEKEPARRHAEDVLQTALASEVLQRRLLRLALDARTFEEEQGVNLLYLAVGFLKWIDPGAGNKPRHGPLLLLPVELRRHSAGARFRLALLEDEINTNLSLQAKLKADFDVALPEAPPLDDLSPDAYFEQVRGAIGDRDGWEVLPNDMVLWFFSFSKFLMHRDLDPECWPADRRLDAHPLVGSLLSAEGFAPSALRLDETRRLDDVLPPSESVHILDCDSSQTLAVEEIRRGASMVIQGPPGTGKSQTISNVIAAAVKEGKTVLFVAEKMAALEVVKRRLDNLGLGDMCLELHSHKAAKREVLANLGAALELHPPKVENVASQAERLRKAAQQLNEHVDALHTPLAPSGITAFEAIGHLARLRDLGAPPLDFHLDDPLAWTPDQRREKTVLLGELASQLREMGNPQAHPWRGVTIGSILPMDIQRLAARIPQSQAKLQRMVDEGASLGQRLPGAASRTLGDLEQMTALGQHVASAPPLDRGAIGSDVWASRRAAIEALLDEGERLAAAQEKLGDLAAEIAWTTDVSQMRRDLAAHGDSWLRWFSADYRKARAALKGILKAPLPKTLPERLDLLDTLLVGQQALWAVEVNEENKRLGAEAFGGLWRSARSDWQALRAVAEWERAGREGGVAPFREAAAQPLDPKALQEQCDRLAAAMADWRGEAEDLFQAVRLDVSSAFAASALDGAPLEAIAERLQAWRERPELVTQWIAYYALSRKAAAEGMRELAERIDQGRIGPDEALPRFHQALYEAAIRAAFEEFSSLAKFSGASHERLVDRFRKLDAERIGMARQEVAEAHYQRIPRGDLGMGELGLVRREAQKKRRHLPLRTLLRQAGRAVQAIKPVFMMSPISIAQFLEPGASEFDLLVIDEASQILPVDALGAIARARQIVVVGDDKQLPPTRFFSKVTGGDEIDAEDEESGGVRAGDLESILDLCVAQGLPQRMLRWHYRSRHHSLIAVSNREFYGGGLNIVPSPIDVTDELGLRFCHVPDGWFDRGKSATNAVEARIVAQAVIDHAREHPGESLGVGAFSVAQRDAIVDELELLRRENPDLEPFFSTDQADPFFVKNLENIQGDERDVIFISIGYAPDKSGKMTMFFGPLSQEGGERRLNVLITRARSRLVVFSSITADQIDLGRTQSRGAAALKTFLAYAERPERRATTTAEALQSAFEEDVADALARHGWQTDRQVGVAGCFVDLAVIDPERPGMYLLGVECDGRNYAAARSSRDRDRIRPEILAARGWILHRVWSVDWFNRPDEQLAKLLSAIDAARQEIARREEGRPSRKSGGRPSGKSETIARLKAAAADHEDPLEALSDPYEEAAIDLSRHDVPAMDIPKLAEIVRKVAQIEGPIHREEVVRRIAALSSRRATERFSTAVEEAIGEALRRKWLAAEGPFLSDAKQEKPPVRNRADVASASLRKPEMLPPAEIQEALALIVEKHLGVSRDDAVVGASRLLGFRATTPALRDCIAEQVDFLLSAGRLVERNDMLYLSQT